MTRSRAVAVVRNPFVHDARVLRAARTLEELGYDTLVVAAPLPRETDGADAEHGVPVVRVRPSAPIRWIERRLQRAKPSAPNVSPVNHASRLPTDLAVRAYRGLRALDFNVKATAVVIGHRPTLVHCNDHNTMWIGIVAKLLVGSRLVYDAHELWPDRNGRWEWRPWLLLTEAVFCRVADQVVVASPGFVRPMVRRYRIVQPTVVRNVPGRLEPTAEPGDQGSGHVAVYAGALLMGRGLEQAIDAVAMVPGVRLRLIGHGGAPSTVAALIERARAAGIEERFEIRPPVAPESVVGALAGASVGLSLFQPVCLSHELTLPNKLFEYVAAGVPVLTSDVALSADFVRRHGIGEVVEAQSPTAVARGLERLMDPDRVAALQPRLKQAAQENNWELERGSLVAAYRCAVA